MTLSHVTLPHYLVAAVLFAISVVGIFLNRKNVIILLMAIELNLLAVNMNFIAFSHYSAGRVRAGVRVLHPDRGGRRVRDRAGDPGVPVPQSARSTSRTLDR
jgi:multisubunit Na+/H+ antiporter MnhC subunit